MKKSDKQSDLGPDHNDPLGIPNDFLDKDASLDSKSELRSALAEVIDALVTESGNDNKTTSHIFEKLGITQGRIAVEYATMAFSRGGYELTIPEVLTDAAIRNVIAKKAPTNLEIGLLVSEAYKLKLLKRGRMRVTATSKRQALNDLREVMNMRGTAKGKWVQAPAKPAAPPVSTGKIETGRVVEFNKAVGNA